MQDTAQYFSEYYSNSRCKLNKLFAQCRCTVSHTAAWPRDSSCGPKKNSWSAYPHHPTTKISTNLNNKGTWSSTVMGKSYSTFAACSPIFAAITCMDLVDKHFRCFVFLIVCMYSLHACIHSCMIVTLHLVRRC